MIIKVINGKIIDDIIEKDKAIYIKDGKIMDITAEDLAYDNIVDAEGNYISAGFIDIHTHGAGGHDFMDGGTEPIISAAKTHLKHGTTSFLPTTLTITNEILEKTLADVRETMKIEGDFAQIVGAHLEGPYFSPKQAGAQDPRYITHPIKEDYTKIIENWRDVVKRWSFAPELPGADEFCKTLVENDIIPSIAHSDAVYEDVLNIYNHGCKLITHFYSGMSLLTRRGGFRILGVVESGYLIDDMMVEVIADGKHLPPELLQLIFKVKGPDNICLVTDSMRGAGMGEGPSILGPNFHGTDVIIEDGIAKMPDRKNFAGSVATSDRLVRTMIKDAGIELVDAITMITKTPAKAINLQNKGQLKKGFDADIVIFNEDIEVQKVFLMGKIIDPKKIN